MKKERLVKFLSYAVVASLSVLVTVILFIVFGNKKDVTEPGNYKAYIGESNLSEYTIYYSGFKAKPAAEHLHELIYSLTGCDLTMRRGYEKGKAIDLVVTDADLEISITDGSVSISAGSEEDVIKAVDVFANTYLGYAFAGEVREHVIAKEEVIKIPDNVVPVNGANAWMPEREPIICLWKTNIARGQYYNTNADLTSEIMTYSDDQLYEYIKMMKYCGFTGIQGTDMCSTWAVYGGYEFVHDRLRFMADAAHSLGMNFTLWVWGAEFTGYGWYDPSVVYHDYSKGKYAFDSEEVIASFDKYYSIYAELADCSDRVIGHYYDPTRINESEEVAYFAVMLRDKMRAVNPDIDFGVSDYTNKYNKYTLSAYLGNDFTLYTNADSYEGSSTADFRAYANNINVKLGVWSWNLVEMEIDQLAEMDVNTDILKATYQRSREDDAVLKLVYWSEMESYHIANIFSLYTAGQLLINPDRDGDELLHEIAKAVVGEKYENDLYEILDIIRDARSGNSMEEFRFGSTEYFRTSDKYPAEDILMRCEKYYPVLEKMISENLNDNTIPLPVSVTEVLNIVRSHLKQIMEFAKFRSELNILKAIYNADEEPNLEYYQEQINAIYKTIPNYDTLIGTWGQAEALAQYKLTEAFCKEVGIEMPKDPVYSYYRKQYMYEEMITLQKNDSKRIDFPKYGGDFWKYAYDAKPSEEIVDELVEEGLLIRNNDGSVYLANWETYVFIGTGAAD